MNDIFNQTILRIRPLIMALSTLSLLSACNSNNDNFVQPVTMIDFRITVSNLTANQPLSPVAVIIHDGNWQLFSVGNPASEELEQLAESGSPVDLIVAAESSANVEVATNSNNPIAPGGSEIFELRVIDDVQGTLHLSVVSMLVNTNDAIAAINNVDISVLPASGSQGWNALTYDAGTEANSETAASIPGPATVGGEGFNVIRDDIRDAVHIHGGVVTSQDGLAGSVLNGTHKWDHPAMHIMIERLN